MVLKLRLVALALMSLSLYTGVICGQGRSSIAGYVFGPERRPVPNIVVELKAEFSTIGRVRTDGTGPFIFRGLGQGRFTVIAMPFGTGLSSGTAEVEIAGINSRGQAIPEQVQQDIYLREDKRGGPEAFRNTVVFAQEVPKEAEALYKNALNDLNSQRIPQAISGFEKALQVFPTYFMALQSLGSIRINEQKFAEAADLLSRAVVINEASFDSWYGLGYARYSLRQYTEAAAAAEKAVFRRADSPEANLLLGMAYRATKSFEKAEQALRKSVKLNDASPDVHWQLALLYGKEMNKYDEAAKELEAYLKLSPEAPNKEDIKKLIKQFKDKAKAQS